MNAASVPNRQCVNKSSTTKTSFLHIIFLWKWLYSHPIISDIYWNCATNPCTFLLIRCFLSICLNTFRELACFIYKGISFQIVAPWILRLNFLISSLANRTCKSFDCLVFLLWSSHFSERSYLIYLVHYHYSNCTWIYPPCIHLSH